MARQPSTTHRIRAAARRSLALVLAGTLVGAGLVPAGAQAPVAGASGRSSTIVPDEFSAANAVSARDLKVARGHFGGLRVTSLTLRNLNAFPVKDIAVRFDIFGRSGTLIEHITLVIYRTIPADSSIKVGDLTLGLIDQQGYQIQPQVVGGSAVR